MFFVSHYNLFEVAVAVLAVVPRIREKFASDPVMLDRADVMELTARAVLAAFEGVDTRQVTEAVVRRDAVRDNEIRAIDRLLMFEERENTPDVKYVLEPLTRLVRAGSPAAPAAPVAPVT